MVRESALAGREFILPTVRERKCLPVQTQGHALPLPGLQKVLQRQNRDCNGIFQSAFEEMALGDLLGIDCTERSIQYEVVP